MPAQRRVSLAIASLDRVCAALGGFRAGVMRPARKRKAPGSWRAPGAICFILIYWKYTTSIQVCQCISASSREIVRKMFLDRPSPSLINDR